ncbi:hypothetical protein H2248_006033 [Termitomyces sp. 'cryptogamus']|nr:hypothetical protein H2248_006033 [Termitomyces sp. 'cryptogamus']
MDIMVFTPSMDNPLNREMFQPCSSRPSRSAGTAVYCDEQISQLLSSTKVSGSPCIDTGQHPLKRTEGALEHRHDVSVERTGNSPTVFPAEVPHSYSVEPILQVSQDTFLHPLGGSPTSLPPMTFTLQKEIAHSCTVHRSVSWNDITKMNLFKRFPYTHSPESNPSGRSADQHCSHVQTTSASVCGPSQVHENRPRPLPRPGPKAAAKESVDGKCKENTPRGQISSPSTNSIIHSLANSTLDPASSRCNSELMIIANDSQADTSQGSRGGRNPGMLSNSGAPKIKRKRSADDTEDDMLESGISRLKRYINGGGTGSSIPPLHLRRGEIRSSSARMLPTLTHTNDDQKLGLSASGSSKPGHEMHERFIESPRMLPPNPRPPPSKVQVINWTNELRTIEYLISQGKTDGRDEERLNKVLLTIERANLTRKLLQESALDDAVKRIIEVTGCKQRVLERLENILQFWAESKLL